MSYTWVTVYCHHCLQNSFLTDTFEWLDCCFMMVHVWTKVSLSELSRHYLTSGISVFLKQRNMSKYKWSLNFLKLILSFNKLKSLVWLELSQKTCFSISGIFIMVHVEIIKFPISHSFGRSEVTDTNKYNFHLVRFVMYSPCCLCFPKVLIFTPSLYYLDLSASL